jgi:DNA-binding transcriptional MerR regulator
MLTIGQLASYAGVTIRAVRHYHQIGLLPEPERDASGYRTYDAAAVVRLIRIRTLAEAGVPLARVRELLDADPETFAAATAEIDRQLRAQIRALQQHRRRIAQLGTGDSLALPQEVVDYLDRLRATGVPEAIIEPERDAWILMAARYPDVIPELMADKEAQLANPKVVRLYQLIARIAENWQDEELLRETADLMSELLEQAADSGELDRQDEHMPDKAFIRLMDSFADAAHPAVARLRDLVAERGWTGWTRIEKRETEASRRADDRVPALRTHQEQRRGR